MITQSQASKRSYDRFDINLKRFKSKTFPEPNTGCHLWGDAVNGDGYGSFRMFGRRPGAHRAAYELFVGEIPKGLQVLHKCDVPCCVNPEHLFLGTHIDNMRDKSRKNRQPYGEDNHSKLKEADVLSIRASSLSSRKLGKLYGVDQSTVTRIKNKIKWKHL